jgi:hypothetical protein
MSLAANGTGRYHERLTEREDVRMGVRNSIVTVALLLGVASAVSADVTGSFDNGQYTVKKQPVVASAATFTQAGKIVTGTVVIGGDAAGGAGAYLVQGKATAKQLKVTGFNGGTKLSWTGKIKGDLVKGKAVLKGGGVKRSGTLAMTKNPPAGDGSSCDAVYTANQQQFMNDLFAAGQVLSLCTECHIPGGQAQSTRFQVVVTDALATARSIATMVDTANPAQSRILTKPTNAVPHGGLQKILPGSDQETKLSAWVNLVAAAACK